MNRPSRVQTPVDVFLDDRTLSVGALDRRPPDAVDRRGAVDVAGEVLREDEGFPECFEASFEGALEDLGLRALATRRDFANAIGELSSRAASSFAGVRKSASGCR